MNWLQSKLYLFTKSQRIDIISHVTFEKFEQLPEQEQADIKYLFTRINSDTSRKSLDLVYDCLIRAVLYDGIIKVFRVNQGENFDLVIELEEGDDYAPYDIVARENETNQLLAGPKAGTDASDQILNFVDLPLAAGEFYKVRIQLEEPNDPEDGVSLLASVYFIVILNVDKEKNE